MIAVLSAAVLAASAPALPYVARGACPFECCSYGTWVAEKPLTIHALPRDRRAPRFTIAAGDSFEAITGNVYVLRPGLVRVIRAIPAYGLASTNDSIRAGQSFYLLDQLGEGGWRTWHRGRVVGVNEDDWVRGREDSLVRVVRWPTSEWWIRVRTRHGRTGWFRMPDGDLPVGGADSCG